MGTEEVTFFIKIDKRFFGGEARDDAPLNKERRPRGGLKINLSSSMIA